MKIKLTGRTCNKKCIINIIGYLICFYDANKYIFRYKIEKFTRFCYELSKLIVYENHDTEIKINILLRKSKISWSSFLFGLYNQI